MGAVRGSNRTGRALGRAAAPAFAGHARAFHRRSRDSMSRQPSGNFRKPRHSGGQHAVHPSPWLHLLWRTCRREMEWRAGGTRSGAGGRPRGRFAVRPRLQDHPEQFLFVVKSQHKNTVPGSASRNQNSPASRETALQVPARNSHGCEDEGGLASPPTCRAWRATPPTISRFLGTLSPEENLEVIRQGIRKNAVRRQRRAFGIEGGGKTPDRATVDINDVRLLVHGYHINLAAAGTAMSDASATTGWCRSAARAETS